MRAKEVEFGNSRGLGTKAEIPGEIRRNSGKRGKSFELI